MSFTPIIFFIYTSQADLHNTFHIWSMDSHDQKLLIEVDRMQSILFGGCMAINDLICDYIR